MKLCLFQGTFNPIHNAHIRICEFAKQQFNFDKILLIPAANPPHKQIDEQSSIHRLKMAQLAAKDIDFIEVSDIEYQRNGLSYTVDTIKEIYKKYEINEKINFIIGTDAFEKIETWYNTDTLKELVDFVLFVREDENSFHTNLKHLQELKNKGYNYNMMKMPYWDISSTQIRQNIHNSVPIKTLVPKEVERYIDKHNLYRK
jgi:nicotinate-nucleotide adenylyltransferase